MHKIFDALDKIEQEQQAGLGSYLNYKERIRELAKKHGVPWDGKICKGPPIWARIERGRWIADCDFEVQGIRCNGAEWVTPGEPFYCVKCGNAKTNGQARPVIFPENKENIEAAVMERPLINMAPGAHPVLQTLGGIPALGIQTDQGMLVVGREWHPGETVKDLRDQHKFVKEMVEKSKGKGIKGIGDRGIGNRK